MHANYSDGERVRIINAATLFFLYLDLYYSVSDYINPSFGGPKTHPDPIERIWILRKSVCDNQEVDSDDLFSNEDILDWIGYFGSMKAKLTNDILPYHIDDLEQYSSVYLPSRGKNPKIDRFDF
jgi:hypothetical protein